MFKKYFLLFLFLVSCASEKKIIVIDGYKNNKINSEQVSGLVGQVSNYYQKSSGSHICIPHSQDGLDAEIESDFAKAKEINISKILQYNQYYVDVEFFIPARKDPLFLRIILKDNICSSFILENFKLYDEKKFKG